MILFSTHTPWSSGYSRSVLLNKNSHRSTEGTVTAGKEDSMGIIDEATGVERSGRTGEGSSGKIGRIGKAGVGISGRAGVGISGKTSGASLPYIHQKSSRKR